MLYNSLIKSNKELRMQLAYCDYIADTIKILLKRDISDSEDTGDMYLESISNPKLDLHPIGGYLLSTKKTMLLTDVNGKEYKITVEEL
tara:strand:+ start:1388 stop:1651 length:264 start_codon:yes stop_codon:yes gene_type:complete